LIRVILNGYNGKMGKVLVKLISLDNEMEIVAGIDRDISKSCDFPIYSDIAKCSERGDVVIDFSHHSALPYLIDYCLSTKTPLLTATTGLDGEIVERLVSVSKEIPVFQTANMSLGVNIVTKLVQLASKALGESFDIEIIEAHHNKKVDSPSGTAYMIANSINEALDNKMEYIYGRYGKSDIRKSTDIGIHAIRGGTISGEHTIIFAGPDEVIEIKHTALSKDVFALGAIKAAKYLVSQEKGLYNMNDVIRKIEK